MIESSVFGLGRKLDTTKAALSFVGLVLFQMIFEWFTRRLERKFSGTVKEQIMQKLYKELMILGLVSFSVFLVYDSGIKSSGLYTFKFAHIVAFMMGIFLLLQAVIFMKAADIQAAFYDRTVATSVSETAAVYQGRRTHCLSRHKWLYRYVPRSRTRDAVELKILQLHFLRRCNLPRSFDFARYMHVGLDATVLTMVHVDVATWSVVLFLALAYAALSHWTGIETTTGIVPFLFMGWATLGLATGLWACARYSELRLLNLAGCDSADRYIAVLERLAHEVDVAETRRGETEEDESGAEELSDSGRVHAMPEEVLSRQSTESFGSRHRPNGNSSYGDNTHWSSHADIKVALETGHASGTVASKAPERSEKGGTRDPEGLIVSSMNRSNQGPASNISNGATATPEYRDTGSTSPQVQQTLLQQQQAQQQQAQQQRRQPGFFTHVAVERERRSSIFRELAALSTLMQRNGSNHLYPGHHEGRRTPHFSRSQRELLKVLPESSDYRAQIYPWGSPRLLQLVRDVLLLLHVCYSALFTSNYCFVPVESYQGRTGVVVGMEIVMITPILVLAVLLVGVARSSALLATLSRPNIEQLRRMAEDAADTAMILREFLTRLRRATNRHNVGPAGLASIVRDAAIPGGGGFCSSHSYDLTSKRESIHEVGLRKDSLRLLLARIGHQLSEQRFRRLFRALDKNKDGVISAEELVALVFPEPATAHNAAAEAAALGDAARSGGSAFEPAQEKEDTSVVVPLEDSQQGGRTNSPSPCHSTDVARGGERQDSNTVTPPYSESVDVESVLCTRPAAALQQQQQQGPLAQVQVVAVQQEEQWQLQLVALNLDGITALAAEQSEEKQRAAGQQLVVAVASQQEAAAQLREDFDEEFRI